MYDFENAKWSKLAMIKIKFGHVCFRKFSYLNVTM